MSAAAALSLAVHAAALLGRLSAGSAATSAAPLAPVLLTRSLVATAVAANREAVAVFPETSLAQVPYESAPVLERREAAAESVPRGPVAATVEAPSPRPPAPAVPPSQPTELALAPAAPLSAPSLTYLSSGGLDPPPRPLTDIDPAVPAEAGPRGGVVVLRLYINERGGVDKAEVLNSEPLGLFDASALEAFGNARFSPGYFAGVAVKSQVTFEVKFRGLGNGTPASARTY